MQEQGQPSTENWHASPRRKSGQKFSPCSPLSDKWDSSSVYETHHAYHYRLWWFNASIGFPTGPAFNLFLRELNVSMGPFILNKLTAPGVSHIRFFCSSNLTHKCMDT